MHYLGLKQLNLLPLHFAANMHIAITCWGLGLHQFYNIQLGIYSSDTKRNLPYLIVSGIQCVTVTKVSIRMQHPGYDFWGNSLLSEGMEYFSQECPSKNNTGLNWDHLSALTFGCSHAGEEIVQDPLVGDARFFHDNILNRTAPTESCCYLGISGRYCCDDQIMIIETCGLRRICFSVYGKSVACGIFPPFSI